MKVLSCAVLLTIALAASAQSPVRDIRATGEYTQVNNDTPDAAKQLAQVAAEHKAMDQATDYLGGLDEVKALQLSNAQMNAYAAAVLEPTLQSARTSVVSGRTVYQADVLLKLDAGAVRRFTILQRDRDATSELIRIGKETAQLSQDLETQTSALGKASGANAGEILRGRLETVTRLHIKQLTARVTAALAKTEESPNSRRVSSTEGRDRAKAYADAAVAAGPNSPDAHDAMGDVHMETGKYDAAEAEYRKALSDTKGYWPGHLKLANALRLETKFPEALSEFREALRIDPNVAQTHADLGLTLNTQGNATDAIAEFREAIRLDPDSIDGHNNLAVVLASQRRIPAAVEEFKEIIRIDPELALGHYNAAIALADMERDAESAAELREVIRINPDHYNAHYNLGELFRLEGKYDDAARQFREYLRLAPDNTPAAQRNHQRAKTLIQNYEGPQQ